MTRCGGLAARLWRSAGAATRGAAAPPRPAPGHLRDVGFDQHLGERVPLDLAFHDETGASVTLGDYFGSEAGRAVPRLLPVPDAVHAHPERPGERARGAVVRAGQEFEVVTVSFDPSETPALAAAKKKAYIAALQAARRARAGWHFLTGDEASIERAHARPSASATSGTRREAVRARQRASSC